jgi:hypothetical protein
MTPLQKSLVFASMLASLGAVNGASAALAADSNVTGDSDPDFAVQGEYSGTVASPEGPIKIGAQVIALGKGKFLAIGYRGGLPGDGWNRSPKQEAEGESKDGVARFQVDHRRAEIRDGVMRVTASGSEGSSEEKPLGDLKKIERKSPTLGAQPPGGAVVLFDGRSADQFDPGKLEDHLLVAGATSKRKFQSCQLHVEFLLPFMPEARGQGRANSGVYLQGRYEVQMLDSFGLSGENNECGGIYGIKSPDVNMCFPPLSWQTYDIDYTAARYVEGQKTKQATISVRHNGIVIHQDVELPKSTTAAPVAEGPEPGPIYLQDHKNPVRYRNIWLVERP